LINKLAELNIKMYFQYGEYKGNGRDRLLINYNFMFSNAIFILMLVKLSIK